MFFKPGVNEHQTVANALQQVSIQTEINSSGVSRLKAYFEDFTDFLASGKAESKYIGEQLPVLLYQLGQLVSSSCVLFSRSLCP
jgi:hypothetical protein